MRKFKFKYITAEKALENSLKDPSFRKAWDDLELEFQVIHEVLRRRIELNMTQEELAKKSGVGQATLSRLENGAFNPTLRFLERIAKAMGKKLEVRLV